MTVMGIESASAGRVEVAERRIISSQEQELRQDKENQARIDRTQFNT